MSFILDALRKSENERQQSAVPGISDVPAVIHRNRAPAWMLGVMAILVVCTLLLGWAWLTGVGTGDGSPATSAPLAPQPGAPASRALTTGAGASDVRSLAREARQPQVSSPPSVPPAAPPTPASAVQTGGVGTAAPVATLAELRAAGAELPELNLELHVFSATPTERFVFINSAKYLEGESLPEGPRLVSITEDGVVMTHRNQSFLLPRE